MDRPVTVAGDELLAYQVHLRDPAGVVVDYCELSVCSNRPARIFEDVVETHGLSWACCWIHESPSCHGRVGNLVIRPDPEGQHMSYLEAVACCYVLRFEAICAKMQGQVLRQVVSRVEA